MKDFYSDSAERQLRSILLGSRPWLGECFYKWICSFFFFLHCVCQADKNIPCQLAVWRGEDSSANEADPLTVFSSSPALSISEIILLVWAGWFKADFPAPPHTPGALCVWVCKWILCIETAPNHHGYIMKRNREEESRSWQCGDSRTQDWQNWGREKSLAPWNNSPENSTAATAGRIVNGPLTTEHVAL